MFANVAAVRLGETLTSNVQSIGGILRFCGRSVTICEHCCG